MERSILPVISTKVRPEEAARRKQAAMLIWVQLLSVRKEFEMIVNKSTKPASRR